MERKETGIEYKIDNTQQAVEYPSKIQPIGNTRYNLVDAHNIDWDSSYLKYLTFIPRQIFTPFAASEGVVNPADFTLIKNLSLVDTRARYNDSKDYFDSSISSVFQKAPAEGVKEDSAGYFAPSWYKQSPTKSSINSSAELLDIIDYLTFATSYTFLYFNELNTILSGITPKLRFLTSMFDGYFGKDNYTVEKDNISNVNITIAPNQGASGVTAGYETLFSQYGMSGINQYIFHIIANDVYDVPISKNNFYYANGEQIQGITSLRCEQENHGIIVFNVEIITKIATESSIDVNQNTFILTLTGAGWEPIENPSFWTGWNDESNTKLHFYTPPINLEKYYAKSNDLTLSINIKKDLNIYEYIFIGNNQYHYVAPYTVDSSNAEAYIINTKFLPNYSYPTKDDDKQVYINKLKEDECALLKNEAVCVSSMESTICDNKRIYVLNNKEFKIDIYPKYYGDNYELNNGQYEWFNKQDETITPDVKLYDGNNSTEITNNSNYTKRIEPCTKNINGVNRKGFRVILKLNHNTSADINKYVNCIISTTPTKLVSGMRMNLKFKCTNVEFLYFVDSRRKFNYYPATKKYESTNSNCAEFSSITNNLKGQSGIGLMESYCDFTADSNGIPDNFTWYLRLPLFTERSWYVANNDYITKNKKIYPSTLSADKNTNALVKPDNAESLYNIQQDETVATFIPKDPNVDYLEGYPSILIGRTNTSGSDFAGNSRFFNQPYLFYTLIAPSKNDKQANEQYYEKWVEKSDQIDIDYAKTWLNNQQFFNACDTDFKNYINSLSTDELKGKAFVGRYCCIKTTENNNIKTKHLVLYRPTIPDNFIDKDVESMPRNNMTGQITGIPSFILYLYVPGEPISTKLPNFEGNTLKVYLVVERADSTLAGWAQKSLTIYNNTSQLRELEYYKSYKIRDLVDCKKFDAESKHNIQTRITTLFTPVQNAPNETSYSFITKNVNGIDVKYYYKADTNLSEPSIRFYTQDYNETLDNYTYKIDDAVEIVLNGTLDSDIRFRGYYEENKSYRQYYAIINRQNNTAFSGNDNNRNWHMQTPFNTLANGRGISCVLAANPNNVTGNYSILDINKFINNPDDYTKYKTFGIFGSNNFITINSSEFKNIYGDNIHIKDLQVLSISAIITDCVALNDYINEPAGTMWRNNSPGDTFGEQLILSIDKYPRFNVSTKKQQDIILNTEKFGKLYNTITDSTYNIKDYIKVNSAGEIEFQQNMFDRLNEVKNTVSSLRLRVIGMMPMTEKTKGFVVDLKLLYAFK